MPIYTYRCRRCGVTEEHVTSYADRDTLLSHEGGDCDGLLERDGGLELPTFGKPAFQTQAVLGNGAHLKGHFGKEAIRQRKS